MLPLNGSIELDAKLVLLGYAPKLSSVIERRVKSIKPETDLGTRNCLIRLVLQGRRGEAMDIDDQTTVEPRVSASVTAFSNVAWWGS
jgi:hypothetical protein